MTSCAFLCIRARLLWSLAWQIAQHKEVERIHAEADRQFEEACLDDGGAQYLDAVSWLIAHVRATHTDAGVLSAMARWEICVMLGHVDARVS